MTIQNGRCDNVAQFGVRQSIDEHTPKHTELMFRKYGHTEFLSKVYESGSKSGVAVTESSKDEKSLIGKGEHGAEHVEVEP